MTTRRLRDLVGLLLIVLALTLGAAATAAPARAGDDPGASSSATTTTLFDDGEQRMIPRPNSGREPTDAGDRGGALQLALLALVVAGVGFVGVKVFRQTRQVPQPRSR